MNKVRIKIPLQEALAKFELLELYSYAPDLNIYELQEIQTSYDGLRLEEAEKYILNSYKFKAFEKCWKNHIINVLVKRLKSIWHENYGIESVTYNPFYKDLRIVFQNPEKLFAQIVPNYKEIYKLNDEKTLGLFPYLYDFFAFKKEVPLQPNKKECIRNAHNFFELKAESSMKTKANEEIKHNFDMDAIKEMAHALLCDAIASEAERAYSDNGDEDTVDEYGDPNFGQFSDDFTRMQEDILETVPGAFEDVGLNLEDFYPISLAVEIAKNAEETWKGKTSFNEFYEEFADHPRRPIIDLAMNAVGHGLSITDSPEVEEWLQEKGVEEPDMYTESPYDDAYVALKAYADKIKGEEDGEKVEEKNDEAESKIEADSETFHDKLHSTVEAIRTECMNCDNKIENEGDAFCKECDPKFALDDDGNVITIEEYEKNMEGCNMTSSLSEHDAEIVKEMSDLIYKYVDEDEEEMDSAGLDYVGEAIELMNQLKDISPEVLEEASGYFQYYLDNEDAELEPLFSAIHVLEGGKIEGKKSEAIKHSLLSYEIADNGNLIILADEKDRETIKEDYDVPLYMNDVEGEEPYGNSIQSDQTMYDVFEDIIANSEMDWFPDEWKGLTEAPMLTDGRKVWYYEPYMLKSPVEDLLNNGKAIFYEAPMEEDWWKGTMYDDEAEACEADVSENELYEYVKNNHKIVDDEMVVEFDGEEFTLGMTDDDLETHINDMVNHIMSELDEDSAEGVAYDQVTANTEKTEEKIEKANEKINQLPESKNCMIKFIDLDNVRIFDNLIPGEDLSKDELFDFIPKTWKIEDLGEKLAESLLEENKLSKKVDLCHKNILVGVIPEGSCHINVYEFKVEDEKMVCTNPTEMIGNPTVHMDNLLVTGPGYVEASVAGRIDPVEETKKDIELLKKDLEKATDEMRKISLKETIKMLEKVVKEQEKDDKPKVHPQDKGEA